MPFALRCQPAASRRHVIQKQRASVAYESARHIHSSLTRHVRSLAMQTTRPSKGAFRMRSAVRGYGACGGLANRSRAMGTRSSGITSGPRELAALTPGRSSRSHRRFQETRPGAEVRGNSLGENRGGARRRARPAGRAAVRGCGSCARLSALRLPSLLFGGKRLGLAWQSSDAMRREDEIAYSSPLAGEDSAQRDQVRARKSLRLRRPSPRRAASRHAALSRKGRGASGASGELIPAPMEIRRRRRAPDGGLAAAPRPSAAAACRWCQGRGSK